MKHPEITKSNPFFEVNNRYCQLLLEEMYLPYLETKGSLAGKWLKWGEDLSRTSTAVSDIENTKSNFEIVERVFGRLCDYVGLGEEEQGWTFNNLIAILWGRPSSDEHLRFEANLLKNASNRILMHYLNAASSRSRFRGEYLEADVNLYKDVLIEAVNMTDISSDSSSVSWFSGVARTARNFLLDDSALEWTQEVLEKPWREIQQTYLEILSELHEIPVTHLKRLSQIPSNVLYFCYQERILRHVPVAVEIIEKSFSTVTGLQMDLEEDLETGEEWLELKLSVKGEVNEVLEDYDKYTELLVSSIPSSARYNMRLSYNIV
jgi:hypothetical protein